MSASLEKNGVCVVESVEVAATFWSRMIGLIGKGPLEPGRALLITHCNSVHTFFMLFDLDLIFLDGEGRVVKVVRNVPPYRMVSGGIQAKSTLEVASGWLPSAVLQPGDIVTLSWTGRCREGLFRTGFPTC